jgi:hypothetical protein
MLETLPKQLVGSLPLVITLPCLPITPKGGSHTGVCGGVCGGVPHFEAMDTLRLVRGFTITLFMTVIS